MEFAPAAPNVPQATAPSLEQAAPWAPPVLRVVCMDIDDTLVDFTAAGRTALAELIGRSDMWPTWERITDSHVAMVVSGDLDYAVMHHRRTACFLAELGMLAEHADVADFETRRRQLARERWCLYSDVLPCLEWLQAAGVRLAAVTNASGVHQRTKLADLGLAGFFDYVAVAGELGVAKPDPVMFEIACGALGCGPSEAAHIGDKLETDARGARDAGLTGVWLSRTTDSELAADNDAADNDAADNDAADNDEQVDAAGVHVINTLEQLPELLVGEFVRIGAPVGG